MTLTHKNKTLATFLAAVLGAFGLHRFYLYGKSDRWGWLHALTLPLSGLALLAGAGYPLIFLFSPVLLSGLVAIIEALVIGVTPDSQWDATHNVNSAKQSDSGWPLAVLLVLTMGGGSVALIAMLARTFDMLYTGGAYG